MGGRDVDGHGLHTAGGVESRETDAHGVAAFSVACVLVRFTHDNEGSILLAQLQPLTLWLCLSQFCAATNASITCGAEK